METIEETTTVAERFVPNPIDTHLYHAERLTQMIVALRDELGLAQAHKNLCDALISVSAKIKEGVK